MRKKLTYEQKIFAVCNVLKNAEMPLSVNQIGKRIGFANGTPIRDIIRSLYVSDLFIVSTGEVAGHQVEYFYLSDDGRKRCVDFLTGEGA